MVAKFWLSTPPISCDRCSAAIESRFFDARGVGNRWGCFCQRCFDEMHCSLGMGRGQRYEINADGYWEKTGG